MTPAVIKLNNIRKELKSILESVEGIGKVYDFYRYENNLSDVIKLFKVDKDYKGAMFRTVSRTDDVKDDDDERTRKFEILIIRQVNDSEETMKQIENLVEDICEEINANQDLNGSVREHNNVQVTGIDERYVSEILCHQAILSLETIESI
jgi:hypothetical protein